MFQSRHLNSKINRIHERHLRIAYKGYDLSFSTLLEKYDSININIKNLQNFMMENINPLFFKGDFCERLVIYNLGNNNKFMLPESKNKTLRIRSYQI